MLYGQLSKIQPAAATPIYLENLSASEKERLVKILFTGKDWAAAQKEFVTDDGRRIHQDEVRRLHDELYAYAEEAKPLVSVGKELADVEIAKNALVIPKGK